MTVLSIQNIIFAIIYQKTAFNLFCMQFIPKFLSQLDFALA